MFLRKTDPDQVQSRLRLATGVRQLRNAGWLIRVGLIYSILGAGCLGLGIALSILGDSNGSAAIVIGAIFVVAGVVSLISAERVRNRNEAAGVVDS